MKLKFTFHGLHPSGYKSLKNPVPYILYDETAGEANRNFYKYALDENKELIAFASKNISNTHMWIQFKLKKL